MTIRETTFRETSFLESNHPGNDCKPLVRVSAAMNNAVTVS